MIDVDPLRTRAALRMRAGIIVLFAVLCAVPGLACRKQATPAATTFETQTFPSAIYLTVHGAPNGAEVWFEGESLGPASRRVSLPYTLSPLDVTITAPGYESVKLSVIPDQPREVTVSLKRAVGPAAPTTPRPAAHP